MGILFIDHVFTSSEIVPFSYSLELQKRNFHTANKYKAL